MSNLPPIAFGVECNTPEKELDTVIQGIRNLAGCRSVKCVVVSTMPGKYDVFTELLPVCREADKILIPGIKFSPLLPIAARALDNATGKHVYGNKFDDHEGWTALADSIVRACYYAERPSVVVDFESAARGYVNGMVDFEDPEKTCEIDLAALVLGISQLPAGIKVCAYPSLTYAEYANPDEYGRQLTIVRSLLMGHLLTGFVDTSIGMPCDYCNQRLENERTLRALNEMYYPGTKAAMFRKMWFYGPDTKYWGDAEGIAAIIGTVKEPDCALIYTGFARFVEGTEMLARLLNLAAGSREV